MEFIKLIVGPWLESMSQFVEHNGRIEQASTGGGGRYDYSYFAKNSLAETYTKEAIRLALVALESKDAPAGKMPVILGSGWPGVLLHEAIGHGLEGILIEKEALSLVEELVKKLRVKSAPLLITEQ